MFSGFYVEFEFVITPPFDATVVDISILLEQCKTIVFDTRYHLHIIADKKSIYVTDQKSRTKCVQLKLKLMNFTLTMNDIYLNRVNFMSALTI